MKTVEPLDVPCPKCGVPPGFPCNLGVTLMLTPREFERCIDGSYHRARTRYAARVAKTPKRAYSRDFTPRSKAKRIKFEQDNVPPTLAKKVRAKLRREGLSLRSLVLGWLTEWVNRPEPGSARTDLDDAGRIIDPKQ